MNILIIDDNADFLEVLETYLTWQDHRVTKAIDGQQGLERFLQSPDTFDLILSDFSMPVMDGLELLQAVRERHYEVPFVFISASYDLELYQKAIALDLHHWLRKPFDFEDLDYLLAELGNEKVRWSSRAQLPLNPMPPRGHVTTATPSRSRGAPLTLASIAL